MRLCVCVLWGLLAPCFERAVKSSRRQVNSVQICLQCQKSNGLVETGVAPNQETMLLLSLPLTGCLILGSLLPFRDMGFLICKIRGWIDYISVCFQF